MATDKPFFTVAITTFDRVELLRKAIESVLGQSFGNFEIIVGNDNQQRSVEICFPDIADTRIRWINHRNNLGYIGNINELLKLSRGEYFIALSDDDLFRGDFLGKMYQVIIDNNGIQVVFSGYESGTEKLSKVSPKQPQLKIMTGSEWTLGYLSRDYPAIGCYGVFEKGFLSRLGGSHTLGSDPGFSPYNDNLLAVQAGLADKVIYIAEPLVFFRSHEGSPSFASASIDAYSSAQKDFLEITVKTLVSREHRANYRIYSDKLLEWFINDYFAVLARGKKYNTNKVIIYYRFIISRLPYSENRFHIFILLNMRVVITMIKFLCPVYYRNLSIGMKKLLTYIR